LAAALFFLMSGCLTQNVSFQPQNEPAPWIVSRDGYSVARIEFDDFGYLWRPVQLTNALAAIRAANTDKNGAIVVTYVHGWHHNATSGNYENTTHEDFVNGLVAKLASDEIVRASAAGQKPRQVIGVYIAWRGGLFTKADSIPHSFYNRSAATGRVAGSAMTEALLAVMKQTRSNPHSRSVLIGHAPRARVADHRTGRRPLQYIGAVARARRSRDHHQSRRASPGGEAVPNDAAISLELLAEGEPRPEIRARRSDAPMAATHRQPDFGGRLGDKLSDASGSLASDLER
jgi:hypothetical protein